MVRWTYPASVRVGERAIRYCGFPAAIGRVIGCDAKTKRVVGSAGKNVRGLKRQKERVKERYQSDGRSESARIEAVAQDCHRVTVSGARVFGVGVRIGVLSAERQAMHVT